MELKVVKQYDIYSIGNALLDMVYEVDNEILDQLQLKKGTTKLVDEREHVAILQTLKNYAPTYACGGSAANTAITAQMFGAKVFYTSLVASDTSGNLYYQDMMAKGIQTNLTASSRASGDTGKCIALITPDSQRTMATYLGIAANISAEIVNPQAIAASRYVYIEGYLVAQAGSCQAAAMTRKIAEQHDVKIVLTLSDQNIIALFRAGLDQIIGQGIDILFCNELEALAYTQTANLTQAEAVLKKISKQYLITLGADGALAYNGVISRQFPEYKTEVIDALGAGDTFAGAFLYAYTQGMEFFKAVDFANLAASHVVAKLGPRLESQEVGLIKTYFQK
jgi:sugar/nucleoside kinase (ribokinase family)